MSKLTIALVLSLCCISSWGVQAQVTPMELRIIQTRLFEKNPSELQDAIFELCKDHDLTPMSSFSRHKEITCLNVSGMPADVKFTWAGEPIFPENAIFQMSFSCLKSCDAESVRTAVRIRAQLFEPGKNMAQKKYQPKSAEFYSPWFDAIAQYLFIEAIEWTPDIQY